MEIGDGVGGIIGNREEGRRRRNRTGRKRNDIGKRERKWNREGENERNWEERKERK